MNIEPTLGRVAFDAYKAKKQGQTYDAKPIPPWEGVGDDVKAVWEFAAEAVKERVLLAEFIKGKKK